MLNTTGSVTTTDLAFADTGQMFDSDTGLQNRLHRWCDPHAGRWISEDPIGFAAGDANLYRYVGNGVTGARDPSGTTTIGEILGHYFMYGPQAPQGKWEEAFVIDPIYSKLWIMESNDNYTTIVKKWSPVIEGINAAKYDIRHNPGVWDSKHLTPKNWEPTKHHKGAPHPNMWILEVPNPPGTDPDTAKQEFAKYILFGTQTEKLHTSAIGSFAIFVTVDDVVCHNDGTYVANLDIWMFNEMSQRSFGNYVSQFPFSAQRSQFMYWHWTEKYTWDWTDLKKDYQKTGGNSNSWF